uniref:Membrane fusogenic activity n=1 Tax=Caenorhabditis tropicalis TaxID=1561998 RepID=A0A1I7UFQ8_9PELO
MSKQHSDQGNDLTQIVLKALVDEMITSRDKTKIIEKLKEDLKLSEEKRLESEASNELKLKELELRAKALESLVRELTRDSPRDQH